MFSVVVPLVPKRFGTSIFAEPLKDTPLIFLAVCKVVAVEALPLKAAVIVPAEKLPDPSLATILFAVLVVVASTVQVVAADPSKLLPVKYVPLVKMLFTLDELVALPLKDAVIVPAEKLPEASLATIVETVFALVALEVIVGFPADPSALVIEIPVPETAIDLEIIDPAEFLVNRPVVAKSCKLLACPVNWNCLLTLKLVVASVAIPPEAVIVKEVGTIVPGTRVVFPAARFNK